MLLDVANLYAKYYSYRQTFDKRHRLVGNKKVDHSGVVGAPPVGATLTTSSFPTWYLASMDSAKTTAGRDEEHLNTGIWRGLY